MSERQVPLLIDHVERERAATERETTFLVEAAAGTGKTTLLVSRLVTIIKAIMEPVTRIVAITFTEKAAGELKLRLRDALEEEIAEGRDEDQRCRAALLSLDLMPVGTIHAFCRDLISERPVEAGVDPSFTVLDERAAAELQTESFEDWLRDRLQGDVPPLEYFLARDFQITGEHGINLERLHAELCKERDTLDSLHVPTLKPQELNAEIDSFVEAVKSKLEYLKYCHKPDDLLAASMRTVAGWIVARPQGSWAEWNEWLGTAPFARSNTGNKSKWTSEERLQEAKTFFSSGLREAVLKLRRQLLSVFARDLMDWLKDAVREYQAAKAARGMLDFQDLLIVARDLLLHHPEVREELKEKYVYIAVDEFQDTDPLQTEIVAFLSEKRGRAATAWQDVDIDEGKLFIVGDPKQSIYRFRRADLGLYRRVKQKIGERGESLTIGVNFRTVPAILSEVNAIFAPKMHGGEQSADPAYVPLHAYRDAGTLSPCVVLSPPEDWQCEKRSAAQSADAEAAAIAQYVSDQVRQAGFSFGDVAILFKSRTKLEQLENALKRREIPFDVSGSIHYGRRAEILALRTAVAAIVNPNDEMSVVGALRSPFFPCSDEELLAHRLGGRDFTYTTASSDLPAVDRAFSTLRELHIAARNETPARVLRRLLEQTPALELFAMKKGGAARVANLLNTVEIARTLGAAATSSLQRLIYFLTRMEEQSSRHEDAPWTDASDSVVRLMTFHHAKGLEFPVVILYRMGQVPKSRETILCDRERSRIELKWTGQGETEGFDALLARDRSQRQSEQLRLLYVAMTRAREQLVLPLYWDAIDKKDDGSLASVVRDRLPVDIDGTIDTSGTKWTIVRGNPAEDTDRFLDAPRFSPQILLQARGAVASEPISQSQEIDRSSFADLFRRNSEFASASSPSRVKSSGAPSSNNEDTRSALRFGSMVHAVMERVALPSGRDLNAVLASMQAEFGADELEAEAIGRTLEQALKHPEFQGLIAHGERLLREVPVTFLDGERLSEGIVDLVVAQPDRLTIVDYKTDCVARHEIGQRAEIYAEQLGRYKRGLQAATGLPVDNCYLFFMRPGVLEKLELND